MTSLKHLSSNASVDEILSVLHDDAGLIIDNLIDQDQVEKISSDLNPYLKIDAFGRDEFTGFKTKRVGALIARSEACQELALHKKINEVSKSYLEPHGDGYQLHFTSAVCIGPGESKQILHRDRGIWGGYLPRKVEPLMSTIWAITEFTKANGATQIVPGSHKWDKDRVPQEDEIAYAEMKAGSVLLYTGTVLHGGGQNLTSNESRTGVFLHYALNWLRQEENQYLSCPPDIAKNLSPEIRSLIGYSKGGYVLGFYSDPHDTSANFESVSPENMFKDHTQDDFSALPDPSELVSKSTK
ncbi:MAG: mitomycin antibiotic biosynthesis protein [Gammaproteobacteria bacterium]|nr:MAG: mitomycin antibiotic biosynthesis protein [Gammaproteobacteria bacterium]|tara:strand:- start:405 stop:1298 length:894 start_codon:yes stop_codon:yes gene_type:complete